MQTSTTQLLAHFKVLADPIRLRMVALCATAECSVSELTEVMSQSQPRVSQQLKQLCDVGILERFRDGKFVYYRVPRRGQEATLRRRLLALLPDDEAVFARDVDRLRTMRGVSDVAADVESMEVDDRPLHRAFVELTVAAPLGDLLDIGCGQGRVLKLLASRARRVVGVDIDSDARRLARTELLIAGIENSSLRKGNMYELPFAGAEFDTVILDDVLTGATDPAAVLREAGRLLRPGGRLLLLAAINANGVASMRQQFSNWCKAADLRLALPRQIPSNHSRWLLAVATAASSASVAA
jgi:ubiquinone/menaquinone biosynthesis C-methylase UbiE